MLRLAFEGSVQFKCKELLNRDHTMCRKERFIGGQTAGLTLRFRVQQPG
jgi:hypothetical protein